MTSLDMANTPAVENYLHRLHFSLPNQLLIVMIKHAPFPSPSPSILERPLSKVELRRQQLYRDTNGAHLRRVVRDGKQTESYYLDNIE